MTTKAPQLLQPTNIANDIDHLRVVSVSQASFDKATKDMVPVACRAIAPDRLLPLDLYMPFTGKDASICLIKVFREGARPKADYLRKMRDLGMNEFYAEYDKSGKLFDYIADRTLDILRQPEGNAQKQCEAVYDNAMLLIHSALDHCNIAESINHGIEYSRTFAKVVRENPVLMYKLPELLTVDYDLYNHSVNVCVLSTAFGAFLQIDDEQAMALSAGALYHDIGKKFINPTILSKPAGLDPMEWAEVRTHPAHSYRILAEQEVLPPEALKIASQHHENLDGTGYPDGLAGEEISHLAAIVRIVDAYDAITSKRCYKPAIKPMEAVLIMINEMNGQLSLDLLGGFLEFMSVLSRGHNRYGYPSA